MIMGNRGADVDSADYEVALIDPQNLHPRLYPLLERVRRLMAVRQQLHTIELRWSRSGLREFLQRRLQPRYLSLIASLIIVVHLLLLFFSFATQQNYKTSFGPLLGADFTAFYNAGSIYRTETPAQVYISAVQDAYYRQNFPAAAPGTHLPYAHAPFLTLFFALLAALPYPAAYALWLALSLGCYLAGLYLLWQTLDGLPRQQGRLALLLALSFAPFLTEAWIGGQTSTLGFFLIALAIYLERRGRPVLSGVVLAFCAFKPSLLFLIGPMLLVTRRWQTLVGFAANGLCLALLSWLTFGTVGVQNYLTMLQYFQRTVTDVQSGLRIWKYVDINAFWRMLFGPYPLVHGALTGITLTVALAGLLWLWWRARPAAHDEQTALWGLTVTATVVINLYNGIYEATLVVIGVMIFCHGCYRTGTTSPTALPPTLRALLVWLYLIPWVSQPLARAINLQLFTVVLLALVVYQWYWCNRLITQSRRAS